MIWWYVLFDFGYNTLYNKLQWKRRQKFTSSANSKDQHIEQGNFLKHEVPIQVNILYCLHTTCCIAGTVD